MTCDAGRTAFFGGRWKRPCPNLPRHVIGASDTAGTAVTITLCDLHFGQVMDAGLVTDPYVGQEEFDRRQKEGWDG